jgi:4-hydroxybenzoate polyprenyltransferase
MCKIIKPNIFEKLTRTIILSLLLVFIIWILFVKWLCILITIAIGIMTIYGFYSYFKRLFKRE